MKITKKNFFGDKKAHELSPCWLKFALKLQTHITLLPHRYQQELEIETQGQWSPRTRLQTQPISNKIKFVYFFYIYFDVCTTLNGSQLTKFINSRKKKKCFFFRTRADGIDDSSRNYYPTCLIVFVKRQFCCRLARSDDYWRHRGLHKSNFKRLFRIFLISSRFDCDFVAVVD